jgi:hypothetical protein
VSFFILAYRLIAEAIMENKTFLKRDIERDFRLLMSCNFPQFAQDEDRLQDYIEACAKFLKERNILYDGFYFGDLSSDYQQKVFLLKTIVDHILLFLREYEFYCISGKEAKELFKNLAFFIRYYCKSGI